MTRKISYQDMAETLGLDQCTASIVYASYFSSRKNFSAGKMTVKELMDFMKKDVLKNAAFADKFGKNAASQIHTLSKFTEKKKVTKPMTASQLSELFGMEEKVVSQIMQLDTSSLKGKTMTLKEFTDFLISDVMENKAYASYFSEEQKQKIIAMNQQLAQAGEGEAYDIKGISKALNLDEKFVTQVFALKYRNPNMKMTPLYFTEFVLNDVINQKQYASKFDKKTKSNLKLVHQVMNAAVSGTKYNANQAAELLGMDQSSMKLLYSYHKMADGKDTVSLQKMVNYLVGSGSSSLGKDSVSKLKKLQNIINASVSGSQYGYIDMASALGMEQEQLRKLYLIYEQEHSGSSGKKLSVQDFVVFLSEELEDNEELAKNMEQDSVDTVGSAKILVDAVVSGKKYSPEKLYEIIRDFNSDMDKNTLQLLYLYHDSKYYGNPDWKLSINQLVNYMVNELYEDEVFSELLEDDTRDSIKEVQEQLEEAAQLLHSDQYSRMMLDMNGMDEMDHIEEFYDSIHTELDRILEGNYYLIGDSAMSYEMSHRFDKELVFITLLTAVAIFLVVAVSFRKFVLPLVLVLLVQCGVYITVTIIGIRGSGLYYLTLLMVECILMGSTIDYGILFSTYYREGRKKMNRKNSLINAYRGAIHTIMTSGSILVIVTGVLSQYFPDPSTAQICQNISIGALCASLLILFILPGILVTVDRFIVKKEGCVEENILSKKLAIKQNRKKGKKAS